MGAGTSLSHTGRAAVLAGTLDSARFDVTLACDQRYQSLLGLATPPVAIHSVSPQQAMRNTQRAQPVIDVATLRANVDEDLRVFRSVSPDVVIGDLRQSLALSSRIAGIPYITVLDPHWSPYARARFEVAEHWLANRLGYRTTQRIFSALFPIGSLIHSLPFNVVSIERGLGPVGVAIRRVYAQADHVLYPSVPELVPTYERPVNHVYMGPIVWSPRVPDPDWWHAVPRDRPTVYVGLGSTGQPALLPTILEALADLPLCVLVATAARTTLADPPRNAFVTPYLSGTDAARRSQLVVCNGGTMSTQQALAVGTPVLGLVSNSDQMVFMGAVVAAGAGERVRESDADGASLRQLILRMLATPAYRVQAERLASVFNAYDGAAIVNNLVEAAMYQTLRHP
jgi:UDP:flavonoid glycosyltransferase YjiC (YdhE family)